MHIPTPEELRRLRKKAGLSQRELAKLAGVSQSLIAKIERGEINPRVNTLEKILKAIYSRLGDKQGTAKEYMNYPVITVNTKTPLREIVSIMDKYGISQIPVVDNEGKPVGTVYETTILRIIISRDKDIEKLKAEDIMEDPLPTITENASLNTILHLLAEYPAVLVMDKNGIKGIITKIDIIRKMVGVDSQKWAPVETQGSLIGE